jgi:hypothetical protein
MNYCSKKISMILGVAALVFMHALAFGANYPLEIIQPQPNLTTASRYYKTYTGFEYWVRVGAIGGLYPYTYSLTVAPSGMTIDAKTGIIVWPNPVEAGSPHSITVSITDSEGTTARRSWTLTVSRTGFYFLDAVNGRTVVQGGAGTLVSPWKTLDDLLEAGTVSSGTQAFFKNGTYNMDGLTQTNHGDYGYSFDIPATKPLIWLAYPGESPTIDFGSSGWADPAPFFGMDRNDFYIAGFRLINPWNFAIKGFGSRCVIAWNTFENLRHGQDGANSAFLMSGGTGINGHYYTYTHDNSFSNVFIDGGGGAGGAIVKYYSETKSLFENNTLSNQNGSNSASQEGLSWKSYNTYCVTRNNTFDYIMDDSIGGNANNNNNNTFEFNLVRNCGTGEGVVVNLNSSAGPEYYYRNTFVCPVTIKNVDSADGPFTFTNNVIVNANMTYSGLSYVNVSAPSRILRANDLTGTASTGIVDTTGALQGSYRTTYLGTRGYETGGESALRAPSGFRILP